MAKLGLEKQNPPIGFLNMENQSQGWIFQIKI